MAIPEHERRPMAKANPLQEQLLKAGLVKKSKVAQVAREQHLAQHAKAAPASNEIRDAAERARAEKAERDRQLAAERKAQAHAGELRAQARQIIKDKQQAHAGAVEYRFSADGVIRTLLVHEDARSKLAAGTLVIARSGDGYALLPRAAAEQVRQRAPELIMLDHGQPEAADAVPESEDDAYYAQFKVPDDLMW